MTPRDREALERTIESDYLDAQVEVVIDVVRVCRGQCGPSLGRSRRCPHCNKPASRRPTGA